MQMMSAHVDAYAVCVERCGEHQEGQRGRRHDVQPGEGGSRSVCRVGLWCLHAAVSFAPVAEMARSVILASATLGPLEWELGACFNVKMVAQEHIIAPSQVRLFLPCGLPASTHLPVLFSTRLTVRYPHTYCCR